MGLFSKAEYLEVILPFVCDSNAEDAEGCVVNIEAHGRILDEYQYCYASFEMNANTYDELSELLLATEQKFVKVIAKVKNGTVKDFKIDLQDMAERFGDKRFEKIALLGWGLNDVSYRDSEPKA